MTHLRGVVTRLKVKKRQGGGITYVLWDTHTRTHAPTDTQADMIHDCSKGGNEFLGS